MLPSNSSGNPLSAGSLCLFMAACLPQGPEGLRTPFEAIALAVHAGMLAVGFRLIGLGEEDRIEAQADAHDPRSLPKEWNASTSYAFRYAHSQSSMEHLIKVNRLGGKAVVFGLAVGDDKTASFDVAIKDYISEGSLPVSKTDAAQQEDVAQKIQHVFISQGRLGDLGSLFKISIIQKLAPGLNKIAAEALETQQQDDATSERRREERRNPDEPHAPFPPQDPSPARPHPFNDPLAQPRQPSSGRPLPEPIPGFEDEYEINRPGHAGPFGRDDRFPGGLGHNDLYPPGLGPHDPLRPHLGGGLARPGFGGGGMHPTFDDPLFGRPHGGDDGAFGGGAPAGARYDPVGPGGTPRDGRGVLGGFPGGGGRGGFGGAGGRPPNPFGGFGDGDFL